MRTNQRLHFEGAVDYVGDVGDFLGFLAAHVLVGGRSRPFGLGVDDIVTVGRPGQRLLALFALLAAVQVVLAGPVVLVRFGLRCDPVPGGQHLHGFFLALFEVEGILALDGLLEGGFEGLPDAAALDQFELRCGTFAIYGLLCY